MGGSRWIGTDTQYCDNIPNLSFSCSGSSSAQYITNPTSQLKGTWNDTTAAPATLTDAGIPAAALRAELAVLEQPTPEMQRLRSVLTEDGRHPCRRTFERRLNAIPDTLPAQIASA